MKTFFLKLFRLGWAFWFLLAIACSLGTITAYFGEFNWLLDLTSHFRLLYCVVLLPAAVFVWFEKPQRYFSVLFSVMLLLNLSQILPFYIPTEQSGKKLRAGQPELKILQLNVYGGNTDYQPIIDTIEKAKPDVIILEEYMVHHAMYLKKKGVFKQYPYVLRDLNTLNAIASRYPLNGHMEFGEKGDYNAILVAHFSVDKNGKHYPMTLITVHPERPSRGEDIARRQIVYYRKVLKLVSEQPEGQAVVVAGDFNATPWSYPFRVLTKKTGLSSASYGFGPVPTFPMYVWRGRIPVYSPLLPIDHVLINKHVDVVSRQTLPEAHSDHLPSLTIVSPHEVKSSLR